MLAEEDERARYIIHILIIKKNYVMSSRWTDKYFMRMTGEKSQSTQNSIFSPVRKWVRKYSVSHRAQTEKMAIVGN
jgi:hypothetical protein